MTTRDWAATTFVVADGRTLLLLHRKLNMWLPPGGHIDPDELPDVAACREVLEETGLVVELLDAGEQLGPVRRLAQPLCILQEQISAGHEHIDLIYVARVVGGVFSPALSECLDARWYSAADLDSPEVAADIRVLGRQSITLIGAANDLA